MLLPSARGSKTLWQLQLAASAFAGYGDLEGTADLTHSLIAEAAEALDEGSERNALDRVEVDDRPPGNGILARLEQYLAGNRTDRRGTRPDEGAAKARDGRVSREDHDWAPSGLGDLAPPDLASRGNCCHDAPAAVRNESRSPHSSASSSGARSYAA